MPYKIKWFAIPSEPQTRKSITHTNHPICTLCLVNADRHLMMDRRLQCVATECLSTGQIKSVRDCSRRFKRLECQLTNEIKWYSTSNSTLELQELKSSFSFTNVVNSLPASSVSKSYTPRYNNQERFSHNNNYTELLSSRRKPANPILNRPTPNRYFNSHLQFFLGRAS